TYWARLEAPFRQYLADSDDPERAAGQWHQVLRRIAWEAWELALLGVGEGAAALRAASIAKRILLAALRPLEPPTPQENPA
ncbi:MAG: type I-E CRISPR-associated protein Cse1/CasA, partial [Deinococcus sp.]